MGDNMNTKIKIVIITIISLLMLGGGLFFAINSRKETINYFYDSGYVINNTYDASKVQTNKEYFEANSAYQTKSDDKYSFQNTDGKKVIVSEESFVHYSNGAIMALKDGVAIDLDKIDLEILNYYNIFEGSLLSKKEDAYEINNLNDTIVFNKMLFKISDDKYLLAANDIVISFSDGQTVSTKDFIEIEYANEDVIRLYNDKVNYQTISSNLYIISDDIKIDVAYKTVSKNDVDLLAMVNMVINANDNIEVITKKEETEDDKNTGAGNGNFGGSGGGGSSNGSSGSNGGGSSNGTGGFGDIDLDINNNSGNNQESSSESNGIIQIPNINNNISTEEETVVQPKFIMTYLNVTTEGVSFKIEHNNSDVFDLNVEIVENATGTIVFSEKWDEESVLYSRTKNSLKPNSAYTINVRGKYIVDENEFDRVFISKIFRTTDLGLNVYMDYVAKDSMRFVVEKLDSSDVTGFTYSILSKDNNEVCSGAVGSGMVSNQQQANVDFEINDKTSKSTVKIECPVIEGESKFFANTDYTLVMKNFEYNIGILYEESKLQKTYTTKTLKDSSVLFGIDIDYEVDYSTDSLVLMAKNTGNDINGGITSYTYKVFSTEIEDAMVESVPLITREVTKTNKTIINISELRGIAESLGLGYDVSVILEVRFDDNEKTIIRRYETKNPIELSGIKYPTVKFEKFTSEPRGYETLSGFLRVEDENNYFTEEKVDYTIVLKDNNQNKLSTNTYQIYTVSNEPTAKVMRIPFDFANIVPSLDGENPIKYDLFVYADQDGSRDVYIGYVTLESKLPGSVEIKIDNKTDLSTEEKFKIGLNIENLQDENLMNLLDNIELVLYSCDALDPNSCEKTIYSYQMEQENLEKLKCNNGDCELVISSTNFTSPKSNPFETLEENRIYKVGAIGTGRVEISETQETKYPIKILLNGNDYYQLMTDMAPPTLALAKVDGIVETKNNGGTTKYDIKLETSPSNGNYIDKGSYAVIKLNETANIDYETECKNISKNYFAETNSNFAGLINGSNNNFSFAGAPTSTIPLDVYKYEFNDELQNIQRGNSYCLIYKGVVSNSGNEEIGYITGGVNLNPSKENVILEGGYLKAYYKNADGKPIVEFALNVTDNDSAGTISINGTKKSLSSGEELEIKECDETGTNCNNKIYKKYSFDLSGINLDEDLKLELTEKLKANEISETSRVLYNNFKLGSIAFAEIEAAEIIQTGENGEPLDGHIKIRLKLNSDVDFRKVLGIKIGDYYYSGKRVESSGEKYIIVPLSLTDIKTNYNNDVLKIELNAEGKNELKVDWSKIMLVYDSNRIDLNSADNLRFLTLHNNPIAYLELDKLDINYGLYNSEKNLNFLEKSFKFTSKNVVAGGIGYKQPYGNNESKIVHHHSVELKEVCESDKNDESKCIFSPELLVKETLTTTKIITMYGESTSNISFEVDSNLDNLNDLVINEIIKTNGNETTKQIDLCDDDSTNLCVYKDLKDNKKINVLFKNLGSELLTYNIVYKGNVTYNSYSGKGNSNLSISLLSETAITEHIKNFERKNVGQWKWTRSDKEIEFPKQIEISYDLKQNIYMSSDSKKEFVLSIVDKDGNVKITKTNIVKPSCSLTEDNCTPIENTGETYHADYAAPEKISTRIDLESLPAGDYDVRLTFNNNTDSTKNVYIRTNEITIKEDEPIVALTSANGDNPQYLIEMTDRHGVLTNCFGNDVKVDGYSYNGEANSEVAENIYKSLKNIYENDANSDFRSFLNVEESNDNFDYEKLSDTSVNKMYYLILNRKFPSTNTLSLLSFSAIPFNKKAEEIDFSNYFKTTTQIDVRYPGLHNLDVLYCTKKGEKTYVNVKSKEFNIINFSELTIVPQKGYGNTNTVGVTIKDLKEDELFTKISSIRYQQTYNNTFVSGTKTVTLSGGNITSNDNSVSLIISESLNNSTYDFTILTNVINTDYSVDDITFMAIDLYDNNGKKITRVEYYNID